MTGSLETLVKMRDVEVAEAFGRMAELGYIDTAFAVYGCAYWQEGKRYYRISSQGEKIYRFMDAAPALGLCPTTMMVLNKTCPVPAGQMENITQDVKRQLALALQEAYTEEFLQSLQKLMSLPANDNAAAILDGLQNRLEGYYDPVGLQLFCGLMKMAQQSKVLTMASVERYEAWLKDIAHQMEEDVIKRDIFEKTFYAIAATSTAGEQSLYINAQWDRVYERRMALLAEGSIVTPIYAKACGYNYTYTINHARADFKTHLESVFDEGYMAFVWQIHDLPAAVSTADFAPMAAMAAANEPMAETFRYYGRLWHVQES